MILIPLEVRKFTDKEEHYQTNVVLDENKDYEIAALNIFASELSDAIGTIKMNVLDSTIVNPHKILARFSMYDTLTTVEYYKLGTYNLRRVILTLEGIEPTSLGITLAIREIN